MRPTLIFAALSGFVAVALDAWTVHAGATLLDERALGLMRTGIEYQGLHSVVLLAAGLLQAVKPGRYVNLAAFAFELGIVLFCGSLYGLALTHTRLFVYLTPAGGTALLVGWLLLAFYGFMLGRR